VSQASPRCLQVDVCEYKLRGRGLLAPASLPSFERPPERSWFTLRTLTSSRTASNAVARKDTVPAGRERGAYRPWLTDTSVIATGHCARGGVRPK